MVKLRLKFEQGLQAIDLPVAFSWIASPAIMQAIVKEGTKVAFTVKITVCSQAESDYLLSQGVIVAEKTRPVKHYSSGKY